MAKRLQDHPSPYLQQHADNPVDWWPWGEAAFAEARERDVPVFLSIGYSTCHWCHVMAHESFEDETVARLLNEAFVCIKVDREERPDIDDAYMQVCQAMTGSGGWPLTVIMTPDKKPFFTGTYFPKQTRGGRIGMLDLVPRVQEAWQTKREDLVRQAEHLVEHLVRPPTASGDIPGVELLEKAEARFLEQADMKHGGFGGAPKFPSPHVLLFLLRRWYYTRDAAALDAVTKTLDSMAAGGIHDQLGGGFHRYSTDREWLLPHFEKMLYDQAMLSLAYTEAYHARGKEVYAAVVRGTLEYLLRDMQDPSGAFYSAEDADSEGEEGKFYVWTRDEVTEALGDDASLFMAAYDVRPEGNHLDEATREQTGKNILHRALADEDLAERFGVTPDAVAKRLAAACKKLLWVREGRVRPMRDEKVLADWNGLAIAAFARAGTVLEEPRFTAAARAAADAVLERLGQADGFVRHMMRGDHVSEEGFLDDHAFMLWGLLELHDATQEERWLATALGMADLLTDRFEAVGGGFRLVPRGGEELPVPVQEGYDGAIPSGNSVAAWMVWRLATLTGDRRWTETVDRTLRRFSDPLQRAPTGFAAMLCAVQAWHEGGVQTVVTGDADAAETQALLSAARRPYVPEHALVLKQDGSEHLMPWTAEYKVGKGDARAFVCRDHACQEPVDRPDALRTLLSSGRPMPGPQQP